MEHAYLITRKHRTCDEKTPHLHAQPQMPSCMGAMSAVAGRAARSYARPRRMTLTMRVAAAYRNRTLSPGASQGGSGGGGGGGGGGDERKARS